MLTVGSQTVSSLGTFILAMTLHPGVQKAAQAEIDRVIGGDRLPSFEDLEEGSLPYITAIMLEVLRYVSRKSLTVGTAAY